MVVSKIVAELLFGQGAQVTAWEAREDRRRDGREDVEELQTMGEGVDERGGR